MPYKVLFPYQYLNSRLAGDISFYQSIFFIHIFLLLVYKKPKSKIVEFANSLCPIDVSNQLLQLCMSCATWSHSVIRSASVQFSN